jgi:cytochrome c biogenesis protein CcdA
VVGLALAVVAIALPDSLNPSLIVADAYLTLGPGSVLRTAAFTIGAFAVTLAGGLVIALGLGDLIVSLLPKLSHHVKYEVLTGLGVALALGGAVIWWRRHDLAGGEPPPPKESASGSGSAVLMGSGLAGVELLTAFPYFAAIAMIAGSSEPAGGKVALLLLYDLVYVLPLIAITVACMIWGERAARRLQPIADWIATHWPVIVAPLVSLVGVGMAVYGLAQLL